MGNSWPDRIGMFNNKHLCGDCAVSFQNENLVWLFCLLPLLALLMFWGKNRRTKFLTAFIHPVRWHKLIPGLGQGWRFWKTVLFFGGLALVILALMRPQFGTKFEVVKRQGLDILIAVDTSLSMLAEDIKPNRLDHAKREILTLLDHLSGNRIGLISFSGNAFVYSPFTTDYSALKLFVNDIAVGMISRQGTSIESVFLTALKTFETSPSGSKILLLYTDGESFDNSIKATLKKLTRRGITIITIGVGTTDGEPIPIKNAQNEIIQYKKDKNQAIVLSKLNQSLLTQIASETKGHYFASSSDHLATAAVYKALSQKEKQEIEAQLSHHSINRYHLFLAAALIFLLIELIIPERPQTKNKIHLLLILTITLNLISSPVYAAWNKAHSLNEKGITALKSKNPENAIAYFGRGLSEKPNSGKLFYNLGNAFYRSGAFDKAIQAYSQAEVRLNKDLRPAAYFNLGNAYLKQKATQKAIDQFKKTLRDDPDSLAAKHNLELALKQLKEQSIADLPKDDPENTDPTPTEEKNRQDTDSIHAFLESLDDAENRVRKRYLLPKSTQKQTGENDW